MNEPERDPLEQQYLEDTIAFKEERNGFIGLIFAFFFAIIGTIPWVIIGLLGYPGYIVACIIPYCATKGYCMFTLKKNNLSGIGVIAVCICAYIFALYLTDTILIYKKLQIGGTSFLIFFQKAYQLIFSIPEYKDHISENCFMGLFPFLGGMVKPLNPFFQKKTEEEKIE